MTSATPVPKQSPNPASSPAHVSIDPKIFHPAIARQIDRDLGVRGTIALPCRMTLVDSTVRGLTRVFTLLGHPLSASELPTLAQTIAANIQQGSANPEVNSIVIEYASLSAPQAGLQYRVQQHQGKVDTVAVQGTIIFPAIPCLRDDFCRRLLELFSVFDRPCTETEAKSLQQLLDQELQRAFVLTPQARVSVRYASAKPPQKGLACKVELALLRLYDRAEALLKAQANYLETLTPMTKVMDVAAGLTDKTGTALVAGVATAQYALPLAKQGWEVDAIDLAEPFANQLKTLADQFTQPFNAFAADILNPQLTLNPESCSLVVITNFATRLQTPQALRLLTKKLAPAMRSGSVCLLELFLTINAYAPDTVAKEMARSSGSTLFTRADLDAACADLPLEIVEITPQIAYEQQHRPAEVKPLDPSYIYWALGGQVFAIDANHTSPAQLQWVMLRRTAEAIEGIW